MKPNNCPAEVIFPKSFNNILCSIDTIYIFLFEPINIIVLTGLQLGIIDK